MRPERARRFQAPYRVSGLARVPRAANDNVRAARGGATRLISRRALMLGALAALLVLVLGWLGRGGQAF